MFWIRPCLIEIFEKKDQKLPNGTQVSVLTFLFNAKVDLDCSCSETIKLRLFNSSCFSSLSSVLRKALANTVVTE